MKENKISEKALQTCIEPAIDAELKLPLISPFGYDFLYKKLEFDESMDDEDEPIRDCRNSFLAPMFGVFNGFLCEYRSIT